MVVTACKIEEVGKPVELLENPKSSFYKLCERTGELDDLKQLASGKRS